MVEDDERMAKLAEHYKQLKESEKLLKKRLAALKEQLLQYEGPIGTLQVQERNLTSYNEDRVWELMDRYGIAHSDFTSKRPDPLLIEQLYLEGRLTDADLRYIRDPKYSYALVDAKEVPDVQVEDDGLSERV